MWIHLTKVQYQSVCNFVDQFVESLRVIATPAEKRLRLRDCALACGATVKWVIEFAKSRIRAGVYSRRLAYSFK